MPPILARLAGIFRPAEAAAPTIQPSPSPQYWVNASTNAATSVVITSASTNLSASTIINTSVSSSNYYYWQQQSYAADAVGQQLANQDYWTQLQAQFNQNQLFQQQFAQMNQAAQGLGQYGYAAQLQQADPLLTPAQQNYPEAAALVERYRAEEAERQAIENAHQAVARGRAKRLLVSHLAPAQRQTFDTKGYFDINKGAYFYRVFLGRSANIVRYMNGRPEIGLCCHPGEFVPDEDTVLAQKFMIEHDEPAFLRLANRHALESSYVRHYLAQAA